VGALRAACWIVWSIAFVPALLGNAGSRYCADAVYYVDSVIGNDCNSGLSPDAPLMSLDELIRRYGRLSLGPCTLNLAGDQVGAFDMSGTGATIQQWEGHAPARIRGSRDPEHGELDWEPSSGTTYRCFIGTDHHVGNVCAKWGTLFATLGRTAGWYRLGSIEAGALSEDQRYFYDAADGFLYFRDDSIGDPALLTGDDRVLWQDADLRIGLDVRELGGSDGPKGPVTVRGITFMHYNTGRGVSYGLLAGGTNQTVIGCTFYDCEVHSLVFSNTPNVNCRAVGCVAYGAGAGVVGQAESPSLYVTHTPLASSDADIAGCRFIDCSAYCYGLLDPNGAPIDPSDFVHGFFGHTSGFPGSTINDLEWDRCTTYHFEHRGHNFYCGSTGEEIDPRSWSSYPVRALECRTYGGFGSFTSGNIAFRRCFFDFSNAPGDSSRYGIVNVSTGCSNLFEACIIVVNSDSDTDLPRGAYFLLPGARLVRINTTTIDLGGSAGIGRHAIIVVADPGAGFTPGVSGFRTEAYGCLDLFAFPMPWSRYIFGDGARNAISGPQACYVSDGCWITGVAPGLFSQNPRLSTAAAFKDVLDPDIVAGVDPRFVNAASLDPDVAGVPKADSPVYLDIFVPAYHAEIGYNGRPFGGERGAIQAVTPVCPCDFDHNGGIDSRDFFAFLNAFFAGDADVNHSGETDSQDFFDFLACFFAPPPMCIGP
jgi:hypothetical protein